MEVILTLNVKLIFNCHWYRAGCLARLPFRRVFGSVSRRIETEEPPRNPLTPLSPWVARLCTEEHCEIPGIVYDPACSRHPVLLPASGFICAAGLASPPWPVPIIYTFEIFIHTGSFSLAEMLKSPWGCARHLDKHAKAHESVDWQNYIDKYSVGFITVILLYNKCNQHCWLQLFSLFDTGTSMTDLCPRQAKLDF